MTGQNHGIADGASMTDPDHRPPVREARGEDRRRIPEEFNRTTGAVIAAAIEVHRHLGPGLLESIYEQALLHELTLQGIAARRQVTVPVVYKDLQIDGQRIDLLVDPGVVVEIKAVERLVPIHEAQLLSYLKSTGLRVGLLVNFHAELLRKGIRRMVN